MTPEKDILNAFIDKTTQNANRMSPTPYILNHFSLQKCFLIINKLHLRMCKLSNRTGPLNQGALQYLFTLLLIYLIVCF